MSPAFVHVRPNALRAFCGAVFRSVGMSAADAKTQSEVLVWANLRGVDSHGVLRVPRYVAWVRGKQINPRPDINVVSSTPACRVIDADRAPGAVAMTFAMNEAMHMARTSGIGAVIARRTTHAGPAGYYARLAAEQSMAGVAVVTSRPNMAYHGASAAGVATSPIAIAVPGPERALVLDMATSSVAIGAIRQARATGERLAENVALTRDGLPTRNPDEAAIPLPVGGPKGSGLSLLFECLLGVLVEHPLLAPALAGESASHGQNGLCAALDIAAFTDPGEYAQRIGALAKAIKALPAVSEEQPLLLPGERGDAVRRVREATGIPIPVAVWSELLSTAAGLGVEPPATL